MSWDKYFMSMCYLAACRSKDPNTKYGAVIVGPDNEIRSTGYNSFVRGIDDNIKERFEKPEKFYHFEHAERNAIYNAVRVGIPLKGCRLYVQGIPCMDCARGIVQAGIIEVIVHKEWMNLMVDPKWIEHGNRTEDLFTEAKIDLRYYSGDLFEVAGWLHQKKVTF